MLTGSLRGSNWSERTLLSPNCLPERVGTAKMTSQQVVPFTTRSGCWVSRPTSCALPFGLGAKC